jgi:phosphate transport system substrate-binding protein
LLGIVTPGQSVQGKDSQDKHEGNMHFRRFQWLFLALALAHTAFSQDSGQLQLIGVGTTFPLPLYSLWGQTFQTARPDIQIKYLPFGSRAGIDMLASGSADFAGTDIPLTDKQLSKTKALHFPSVLGAIVPIYNVPGVTSVLRFSPKALAGIYLGTITKWSDPAISDSNPEVHLPSSDIVVIHSVSGRGSTYIWSDYLSKVSAEWRTKVGRGESITWPLGKEAEGNGNVAKMVKETLNSIGYVEVFYAAQNHLPRGLVQNSTGNFIAADSLSISAAAAAAAAAKAMPADFRASITNSAGEKSYPIASFTWILIPEKGGPVKQQAVKDFLRWMLTEGQSYAEQAGFTKLPKEIVEQELKAIEEMR